MARLDMEDRRERSAGYYISGRQFWIGLVALLSVLGMTPFAVARWVLDQAITENVRMAVEKHNGSADAHKIVLDRLIEQRSLQNEKIIQQLMDVNTRLSRIEGALERRK
jgi:hypothetical protein